MKKIVSAVIMLFILICTGCRCINHNGNKWELVWQQEFDTDGAIDPAQWTFEQGFVRNREAQYYTDRKENCIQKDGCLIITGKIEEHPNLNYVCDSKDWRKSRPKAEFTSAALRSCKSFCYGRFEMRAQLPTGKGTWPAFWLLGESNRSVKKIRWPACGEVDIMENVGFDPNKIHSYVHYADNQTGKHKKQGTSLKAVPHDGFHTYTAEWNEDKIIFFFDGRPHFTFIIDDAGKGDDNPFRKPHFILVNLALGGSWGGDIDRSSFPKQYKIDYIRVWQKKKQD